jgi:hypothetical protein
MNMLGMDGNMIPTNAYENKNWNKLKLGRMYEWK